MIRPNHPDTIPVSGWYQVFADITFVTTVPTGFVEVWFQVNGTTIIANVEDNPAPGSGTTVPLSTVWYFNTGDYIECIVQQTSGIAINVGAQPDYSPEFGLIQMGY